MSATANHYPLVDYNPAHYIPIGSFQKHWLLLKEEGANRVEDPYGRNPDATAFGAGLNATAPFVLIISMMVILASVMGIRASNIQAGIGSYLSSPSMVFALVMFFVALGVLYKKVKFAASLKNSADFSVLESARRYLKQRYGFLPKNWEHRFISYLVDEEVPENRFSETYELTVKNFKGYNVIMVTNINGEHPVKN